MEKNDRIKETFGYKSKCSSQERGYQVKINDGYQPSTTEQVKVPKGGTGAVTPKKEDH